MSRSVSWSFCKITCFAEILRDESPHDFVALLVGGIELLCVLDGNFLIPIDDFRNDVLNRFEFDGASLGIELHQHFRAALVLFLIRGRERVFQRFYKRLFADPLFLHQIGQCRKKLLVYHCIRSPN